MKPVVQLFRNSVPVIIGMLLLMMLPAWAETEPEGIGGTGVRPEQPEVFERPDIFVSDGFEPHDSADASSDVVSGDRYDEATADMDGSTGLESDTSSSAETPDADQGAN